MESLASYSSGRFPSATGFPSVSRLTRLPGRLGFLPLVVRSSSREQPELDKWDQMELKFGRLLGEDPKLTLAKVMARKANPDVSYLEVEETYKKNKGKLEGTIFQLPDDMDVDFQQFNKENPMLNLSRPIMKKGAGVRLVRPAQPPNQSPENNGSKTRTSNIALRKPSTFREENIETEKYSKPNLFMKMRKDSDANSSDVTLLKKPEAIEKPLSPDQEGTETTSDALKKPLNLSGILRHKPYMTSTVEDSDGTQQTRLDEGLLDDIGISVVKPSGFDAGVGIGLRPPMKTGVGSRDAEASITCDDKSVNYDGNVSRENALLGKPQRVDSFVKEDSRTTGKEPTRLNEEIPMSAADVGPIISANQEEHDDDWKMAESLLRTGERAEVELVSCSSRGFAVSFGSVIGFLPYRNLGAKWKFLAFESWLRKKGLDPSLYRQKLSIIGSYDVPNKDSTLDSNTGQQMDKKDEEILPQILKFEDLLKAYDEEKTKFLSSFVGQIIKVSVILADRNCGRLMFSGRPKEKEELVEKKRSLMAKLSVGDVVKCCIKKITYFGIFVEIEGVSALVHQSEVSWDATLDPSSYYKIGQMIEAKVHQLDYALERITLSLKEIMPDPLMEALESVVGDHTSLGGSLEAAQADVEWADVESLIEELQQVDGVQSVSKGRFFKSPGLAPTFQVYMASVFDNQYKLLARYGNKAQEIVVQASLDKELMKAAILACTNRVK